MDKQIIELIINLNNDFYNNVSESFSTTRQYAWKGWEKVVSVINSLEEPINIVDIGCGNGRFLGYLNTHVQKEFSYTGYDNNESLLTEAKNKYGINYFKKVDVIRDIAFLENEGVLPNVVTAFGVTHHIPGNDFRSQWFQALGDLLESGYLIFTLWNINTDARFKKAKESIEYTNIELSKPIIEEGDWFLGWQNSPYYRYYHKYSKIELENIIKVSLYEFEQISSFNSDGKDNKLNTYYILKRN